MGSGTLTLDSGGGPWVVSSHTGRTCAISESFPAFARSSVRSSSVFGGCETGAVAVGEFLFGGGGAAAVASDVAVG